MSKLRQPLLQAPQGGEQVAAVDRRDVARLQRLQSPQVVPVQQVTFVARQGTQCLHGPAQPLDHLVPVQVAEITGCQGAERPHPDVGGAGSQGELIPVRDLIVVGRQPGGLFADEFVEEAPGPPCNQPQQPALAARKLVRLRRRARPAAQLPPDQRCEGPQTKPGRREGEAFRPGQVDQPAQPQAQPGHQAQLAHKCGQVPRRIPLGHLGRVPLQQLAFGHPAPPPDCDDGLYGQPGLVGEQGGFHQPPQQIMPDLPQGQAPQGMRSGRPGEGLRQRPE